MFLCNRHWFNRAPAIYPLALVLSDAFLEGAKFESPKGAPISHLMRRSGICELTIGIVYI